MDFGPTPRLGKSSYQLFDAAGRSATIYRYYEGVVVGEGREWVDYGPAGVTRADTVDRPPPPWSGIQPSRGWKVCARSDVETARNSA